MGANRYISNAVEYPADDKSIIQKLSLLPDAEKAELLNQIINKKYPDKGYLGIKYDWELWGRPSQHIPLDFSAKWSTFVLNLGRGAGKGCSLSTPIATPYGWTTMGEIKVGDQVFDEAGIVCNVTGVTDNYVPQKAYRLWFSDGTYLDVCDEHQWVTFTARDRKAYLRRDHGAIKHEDHTSFPEDWPNWRKKCSSSGMPRVYSDEDINLAIEEYRQGNKVKDILSRYGMSRFFLYDAIKNGVTDRSDSINENIGPTIKTTQDVIDTFYYGKRNDTNHCIPNARALNLPEKNLPIDPYLYGMFLGDGCSHTAYIASHIDDYLFYKEYLSNKGITVREFKIQSNSESKKSGTFGIEGFYKQLRENNCLRKKTIISDYLRASVDQRLETVRGLLDTDGSIDKRGKIEFCNTNKEIFDFCYELLVSLGQKPTVSSRMGKLYGVEKKLVYRLNFNPTNFIFFNLPRKINRIKTRNNQALRNHHRMIVKYEEISPIEMKCIQVDSKNSMYLLGSAMIPSHNTRTSTEWVRHLAETQPGVRIALVGATTSDVMKTMLTGDSGLISICPPWNKPEWNQNRQRLDWSNGSIVEYFTAETPSRLRGPQFHYAWADEITSWNNMEETFDMLSFGLRLGNDNRIIVSTTPKNLPDYKKLLSLPTTWTLSGSTFANMSNLSEKYIAEMKARYEGTTLGQQELHAELLDDDKDALWRREWIDRKRIRVIDGVPEKSIPDFYFVVVAVDPAMTAKAKSDYTGITVAAYGADGNYYVIDSREVKASPKEWAELVVKLYDQYMGSVIVAEVNQGGELVAENIKNVRPMVPLQTVHAKRGKVLRAEPVAHLYELGKVIHVGTFNALEDQMCMFNPVKNPTLHDDLVDSLTYAISYLDQKYSMAYLMDQDSYSPAIGGTRDGFINFQTYYGT